MVRKTNQIHSIQLYDKISRADILAEPCTSKIFSFFNVAARSNDLQ